MCDVFVKECEEIKIEIINVGFMEIYCEMKWYVIIVIVIILIVNGILWILGLWICC